MADQMKPPRDDHDYAGNLPLSFYPAEKRTTLESMNDQPSKKKPKTQNWEGKSKIDQQSEQCEETLVKLESEITQFENGFRESVWGKEVDADDADDGYHFVENDDDDSNYMTTHCQQSYTVLSEDDIRQRQEEDITRISTVLSISSVSASILLHHYNWSTSKVHDAWFTDEEKVRMTVGLLEKSTVHSPNVMEVTCGICFENYPFPTMYSARCSHLFCTSCWEGYISTSIKDGPGCLTLRCPDPKCGAAVDQDMVNLLVSDEDKAKYNRYLLRSYIEDNRKIKWCPAPGCDYAVDFVVGSESYDVSCNCTYSFCWNCLEEAHRPVDCDTVAKWKFKNSAESENVTWILAYSKPCPKCKRPIEKNRGCMHMTCTPPCKFEFCWLCLGSWSDHLKKTGTISCNGYKKGNEEGPLDEAENIREMAKKSLERYTHYYERWATNQSSRQKAIADLQQMQTVHIEKLSNIQSMPESQLKFITEAWLQIIECRRVLKWTYAYGYYLPEHEHAKRQLFEYLQGEAESGLERLHHCAEQDLQEYLKAHGPSICFNEFRTKLAGLTRVTRNYFENLVRALENGLADVDSHGDYGQTGSSKDSQGGNKEKRGRRDKGTTSKPVGAGRGKGVTSKSGAADRAQEDQTGTWSCSHCTYFNDKSAILCQMCALQRDSWFCERCTGFIGLPVAICPFCNHHR